MDTKCLKCGHRASSGGAVFCERCSGRLVPLLAPAARVERHQAVQGRLADGGLPAPVDGRRPSTRSSAIDHGLPGRPMPVFAALDAGSPVLPLTGRAAEIQSWSLLTRVMAATGGSGATLLAAWVTMQMLPWLASGPGLQARSALAELGLATGARQEELDFNQVAPPAAGSMDDANIPAPEPVEVPKAVETGNARVAVQPEPPVIIKLDPGALKSIELERERDEPRTESAYPPPPDPDALLVRAQEVLAQFDVADLAVRIDPQTLQLTVRGRVDDADKKSQALAAVRAALPGLRVRDLIFVVEP